jgi:hypothetical protein
MSDAHVGRRRREADRKVFFVRTTCSDNANASSLRRPLLAPAGPVNGEYRLCRRRDRTPHPGQEPISRAAAEIIQGSQLRSTAITLTPDPSVHVDDFACMRLITGHEVTNR